MKILTGIGLFCLTVFIILKQLVQQLENHIKVRKAVKIKSSQWELFKFNITFVLI